MQGDAVFREVPRHGRAQSVAVLCTDSKFQRVIHLNLVGLDVQVTRRDPGPARVTVDLGQTQLLRLRGSPGDQAVQPLQAQAVGAQALGQWSQGVGRSQ